MALGEEFRFEFQRSMPMRASKFECTYSKFDRHVLFLLASLRRGESSTTLSILQLSSSYEVAGPQDIPKPWFIGKGTTSWSWCFSSLDSAWQAIVMDLPHKQASFRVLSHHFQDSRGLFAFNPANPGSLERNLLTWRQLNALAETPKSFEVYDCDRKRLVQKAVKCGASQLWELKVFFLVMMELLNYQRTRG